MGDSALFEGIAAQDSFAGAGLPDDKALLVEVVDMFRRDVIFLNSLLELLDSQSIRSKTTKGTGEEAVGLNTIKELLESRHILGLLSAVINCP